MNDKIILKITRRRLTECLIGLVALFFASGFVAAILKYLWPQAGNKDASSEVRIATVDEVPTGTAIRFMFNGKAAVLLHMPAGFRAFGAVCTHLGCVAYWKPDESIIFCPCHIGKFDPNTGAVISGPPPSPLPAIEIAVREGAVYALRWKDPDYVRSISFYAGAA
ncbi:ferredoxin subunit of nitrite reductase and ring-hydroxylating dioxygenase [Candidatus Methanoperedens nitroreducens]|uniref:Ferredoxin subunit of nitrite reductase and ring-hydroxylating dioxygenase n=1 Tax=Candidatus Methanoperedens nitratireducens TaxID=1392998 RepID=A0A062V5X1_9EURY|nr:Rieske (2Fe-2S) protein [Candidatus Methanoperedens nitroreducens]KCZ71204.1 ferredoxin subunit of nitrite reductase and ring-hydroxylating dioxygenase [Candidatus Methanoperedens nitroreducens]MDJ1421416.1 Rieske (2Fe-2S) protein [Candidatus Methanoperedens sp.]